MLMDLLMFVVVRGTLILLLITCAILVGYIFKTFYDWYRFKK